MKREWILPVALVLGLTFVGFIGVDLSTLFDEKKADLPPGPPYWLHNNMSTEPTLVRAYPDNKKACEALSEARDKAIEHSKSRCEPAELN